MKCSIAMVAFAAFTFTTPMAMAQTVIAQAGAPADTGDRPANASGPLLRQNNITSTGATVPHPGASQSNGPTPLDNSMNRQDDKIQSSICKGC